MSADPIRQLGEILRECGLKPVFGLVQQGHIPTIERMLSEGREWHEIGKEIGWNPNTAKMHYGWHIADKLNPLNGSYRTGTLVKREEITCEKCRKKWDAGMRRVRALFRNYRGEE